MKNRGLLIALGLALSTPCSIGHAVEHVVVGSLDASTNPPSGSAGVGFAAVTIDAVAHTLTIDVSFSGLAANAVHS